jgi:polysaccharide biosynthesis protein PslG
MKPEDIPPKDSGRSSIARQDNPYGVLEFLYWNHPWNNHQYPNRSSVDRSIALMKQCGIGIVRMDFLWQDIEPVAGKHDYKKYDYIVDMLTRHNIAILGVLSYNADWASPSNAWNVPGKEHSLFIGYCRRVCRRYYKRVKFWEIWNEPDSPVYWEPQDGLVAYVGLLRDAYVALKQIDPSCTVLNGGLSAGLASVNKLYDEGAKDHFDIMNIHAFESPIYKDAMSRVVSYVKETAAVMDRNGDSQKKIWVTEIGCPGVKAGMKVSDSWLGENPTELQQASWVTHVFNEVLALDRVDKVFWAFFRDTDNHWKNGTDYLGLVRNDFSPKPAFSAFQKASLY